MENTFIISQVLTGSHLVISLLGGKKKTEKLIFQKFFFFNFYLLAGSLKVVFTGGQFILCIKLTKDKQENCKEEDINANEFFPPLIRFLKGICSVLGAAIITM